jgi:hypothetical protein
MGKTKEKKEEEKAPKIAPPSLCEYDAIFGALAERQREEARHADRMKQINDKISALVEDAAATRDIKPEALVALINAGKWNRAKKNGG